MLVFGALLTPGLFGDLSVGGYVTEVPQGERAYTLVAVCIALSIVAYSCTDVPIARAFDVEELVGIPDDDTSSAVTRGCGPGMPGKLTVPAARGDGDNEEEDGHARA